jgi:hypothetical protein
MYFYVIESLQDLCLSSHDLLVDNLYLHGSEESDDCGNEVSCGDKWVSVI